MRRNKELIYWILICFLFIGCSPKGQRPQRERIFTDALGREVSLPDSIRSVIPVNESTMRMVSYVKGSDLVAGIEDVEMRGVAFTHIFASPEIRKKPMIGPMFGGDPELIMLCNPDVVLTTNISRSEADELQEKLMIPVVVIRYGNLGKLRSEFMEGLRLTGDLLNRRNQADSLIAYLETEIADLAQRTQKRSSTEAYLGGISYRGRHDIVSTDPYYAAFELVNVPNTAIHIDSTLLPKFANTTIDIETLIKWNPEIMFIDQGGLRLVQENFRKNKALSSLLTCYKNKEIYLLWPYYMFHSNFEVMLLNSWYVGKVMYPDAFADVDLKKKSQEIMTRFVGKDVTDSLVQQWGWYRNITDELADIK